MNLDNEKDFKVKLNFKATISYKIKAEDVRLVIKEVSGVELTTENVSF